jgi:hypothetical protein
MYWEFGAHVENTLKTSWELDGNTLKPTKKNPICSLPHPPQSQKHLGP